MPRGTNEKEDYADVLCEGDGDGEHNQLSPQMSRLIVARTSKQ